MVYIEDNTHARTHAHKMVADRSSICLLVLCIMCIAQSHHAAATLPISAEELEGKLDEFIGELLTCRAISGVSIAAVHGNDILVTKGYGYVDRETKANVTEKSLFGVASLSKAFTAALLGIMLEKSENGYTWDTEVRAILGDEFYFHDALRTNNAVLRDLLSHRMGYPNYNNIRHQSGLDRQQLVKKVRFLIPDMPFRSKYEYNNLMYGVLAYATEVIGGDTWERLMKRHIFDPLGMTSTDFTHEIDLDRTDLVKAYETDYDGSFRQVSPQFHSFWGKIGGSGSVTTSAEDMAQWVRALLNKGINRNGSQVIPEAVLNEAFTPQETTQASSSDRPFLKPQSPVSYTHMNYGFGWRIGYYRGWQTYHHTGTSLGYLAQVTLVPDLDLGIHTSLSGDDPGYTVRRLIHLYTLDLLMGEVPWMNLTSACSFPQGKFRSQKPKNNGSIKTTENLQIYTGTFGNFAFGNLSFHVNETMNSLMMAYGDYGIYEMRSRAEDHGFDAIGVGHVWMWVFNEIVFSYSQGSTTGPVDHVTIYSFDYSNPPVFSRDVKMSAAPPPPDLECPPDVSCAIVARACSSIIVVVLFMLQHILY